MGERIANDIVSKPSRMMKSVLFVALLVALASPSSALPADNVIPEDVDLLQQTAYADAVERVNSLLAKGNDNNACAALANSEKKAIQESVNTNQVLLNGLPSGKACKLEGQELVSSTRNEKNKKRTQLTKAQGAVESAGNAEIDFGKRTFLSMSGTCAIAKTDGKYVAAKSVYDAAKKKLTTAVAEHTAAEKAYTAAVAAAKKKMEECECDVQKKHADAWKKVNAANASNQKGWTRATHMLCVVGGTSYQNCKGSTAPAVEKPPIDDGAKNAKCGTQVGFYKMKQGTCCCPSADRIGTREECKQAMVTLGLKHASVWTGSTNTIPGGCGWRNYDRHNMHWNTQEPGKPRKDMVPVCRGP